MVLMSVSQNQRFDLSAPCFEIGEIGDDEIDAQQVGLGKHRAGIDDDGRFPTRDGHGVQAELAEAAERHDIDRWGARGRSRGVHRHAHLNPSQAVGLKIRHAKPHAPCGDTTGGG